MLKFSVIGNFFRMFDRFGVLKLGNVNSIKILGKVNLGDCNFHASLIPYFNQLKQLKHLVVTDRPMGVRILQSGQYCQALVLPCCAKLETLTFDPLDFYFQHIPYFSFQRLPNLHTLKLKDNIRFESLATFPITLIHLECGFNHGSYGNRSSYDQDTRLYGITVPNKKIEQDTSGSSRLDTKVDTKVGSDTRPSTLSSTMASYHKVEEAKKQELERELANVQDLEEKELSRFETITYNFEADWIAEMKPELRRRVIDTLGRLKSLCIRRATVPNSGLGNLIRHCTNLVRLRMPMSDLLADEEKLEMLKLEKVEYLHLYPNDKNCRDKLVFALPNKLMGFPSLKTIVISTQSNIKASSVKIISSNQVDFRPATLHDLPLPNFPIRPNYLCINWASWFRALESIQKPGWFMGVSFKLAERLLSEMILLSSSPSPSSLVSSSSPSSSSSSSSSSVLSSL
jgi:hypothetical protein